MGRIDRIQVWLYDVSKLVITAILLILIALFFLPPSFVIRRSSFVYLAFQ